eukprot:scaffold95504_cov34-Tisochrysis_lutea.AAC.2
MTAGEGMHPFPGSLLHPSDPGSTLSEDTSIALVTLVPESAAVALARRLPRRLARIERYPLPAAAVRAAACWAHSACCFSKPSIWRDNSADASAAIETACACESAATEWRRTRWMKIIM